MQSLEELIVELDTYESNYRVQFSRLRKIQAVLSNIDWISVLLSLAITIIIIVLLCELFHPTSDSQQSFALLVGFYGGLAFCSFLHSIIVKPILEAAVHYAYKVNKLEFQALVKLREGFEVRKLEVEKVKKSKVKAEFYDRETKLGQQLDFLVRVSERASLPIDSIQQVLSQLTKEDGAIQLYGYQIHKSIFYRNRFEKVRAALEQHAESLSEVKSNEISPPKSTPQERQDPSISSDVGKLLVKPIEETVADEFKRQNGDSAPEKLMHKVDFLKLNEHRQNVGQFGELYILEKERNYLSSRGLGELAMKVKHVSAESDAEGYDILSFSETGNMKFIEVKTTTGNQLEPFFLSSNEITAKERLSNYWIYRVYNFNLESKRGDLYKIDCSKEFDQYYDVQPVSFVVTPIR